MRLILSRYPPNLPRSPTPPFFTSAWSPVQSRHPCSLADWLFQWCLSKGFWLLQDQTAQAERKSKISPQNRPGKKAIPHQPIYEGIPDLISLSFTLYNGWRKANTFKWSRSWSKGPCGPWMLCPDCHHWVDGTKYTRRARHLCCALGICEKADQCWTGRCWCRCSKTGYVICISWFVLM